MKEYEMELRVVVKIHAHDIDAAQNRATELRTEMREAFPAIETMEFGSNYSLRPCHDDSGRRRIRAAIFRPDYPDPHHAREYLRRHQVDANT